MAELASGGAGLAAGGAGLAAGGAGLAAGGAWADVLAGEPDLAVLEATIFAATPDDVRTVVISGRDVVVDGRHVLVEDVPGALTAAIRAVRS